MLVVIPPHPDPLLASGERGDSLRHLCAIGASVVTMILADQGLLDLGGMRLEYRMIGPRPEEAPTIVVLHEGLGCVGLWNDFPDKLPAATGAGVFVYSRAGYGKSSPVALPRPLTFMHDEAKDSPAAPS